MQYEDALRKWGKAKLEEYHGGGEIQEATVEVKMEFDEGYACCGGSDPDCYCSLAESPSANVLITGNRMTGGLARREISHYEFDFVTILKELVTTAEGNITA